VYQHIFFDLDHTLWDFEKNSKDTMWQLYNRFQLQGRGITDFEAFYEVYRDHNEKLWVRFRKGFIKRDELRWKRMWHTLLDFKIGDTKVANELSSAYLEILPTQKFLVPDAMELVQYCAQKYTLHIITNGFETTQRQKLYNCGLLSYFDQIITSEKSNSIKPNKEIFDFAKSAAGANTNKCIMIGDALEIDVLGAINAGWDAIYYNPGQIPHQHKPTHEVNSLKTIMEIL
jgi:putative hydrolase of the HAD superfamily